MRVREATTTVGEFEFAAIEIDSLHVSYGSQRVLHGVNLKVAPGEFIAILGSSGCGKTTLLRTIAGFQKASRGAIRLFGRDVVNCRRRSAASPWCSSPMRCGRT